MTMDQGRLGSTSDQPQLAYQYSASINNLQRNCYLQMFPWVWDSTSGVTRSKTQI